jgi:hypothetical protein
MTQVYLDHNGYLWTFELVGFPFDYMVSYENGSERYTFQTPRDADLFREVLGMELLGEL